LLQIRVIIIDGMEKIVKRKIKSIEYIDDIPDFVYNIEVEDNHNYYVNGILTHNCDDPTNPKMAASVVEKRNVINFYSNTLYSRLNQPELGVRIIIAQRLAEDDLPGHLIANSPNNHDHICIPVEVDLNNLQKENISPSSLIKYYDKDGLFWPDRFSKKVVLDFIKMLGSREAAGQLYQRPAPKEGNMVKESWFDIIEAEIIERDLRMNPMMFYLDTAESDEQQESGDSTGIVVAYKKDNCVYIANVITIKKAFHELVKFIPEFLNANLYSQYSKVKIEPKSSGKSIVSQLRATTQLSVMELPTPKDSKVVRMSSITPMCESRRVKFINGNYLKPFMSNLLVFPNGKHDDDVDAFIHCVEDLLARDDFDFTFI
jgi:predicted phage terminase large subunit-like protein